MNPELPRIGDRVRYAGNSRSIAAAGSLGTVVSDKSTWWGRLCFVRWNAINPDVARLIGPSPHMEWARDLEPAA
jgi:hypothetical protein